ncbi:uncharacterized protein LOC111264729 isoform X2 [Varroa jacobsoni]|uniref:uncharacterized protein LOC111264729 isoform X2 n=1 Tax=Varroa jacobsoni TaxID=62625 RepID=UPI000BF71123|nr:uncharacterized protein LOC111264729 isoform X2 [Varroa jacobsoni]
MFLTSITGKRGPTYSNGKVAEPPTEKRDEGSRTNKLSLEDRVVALSQQMYRVPEKGLLDIYRQLNLPNLEIPERKINVLLVGNHSSGKSTFINWYIGEDIQKTGVAMETSKFSLICHGKRRETLSSNTIMQLFPKFEPLTKIPGIMDHLCGEVSESTKNQFRLVNFIDTPGLVDGADRYTYDIDSAMDVIAAMADLIFVFIDPQGQALCQRTITHIERFCRNHAQKLSLWLTKCDLVEDEADRLKVMQQVSAELARRPAIARENLWLYPIFIPGLSKNQPNALNQLSESLKLIERAISINLQDNVLQKMISHCDHISKIIGERRDSEEYHVQSRCFLSGTCAVIPICVMMVTLVVLVFYVLDRQVLKQWVDGIGLPHTVIVTWDQFHNIPAAFEIPVLLGGLIIIAAMGLLATSFTPKMITLDEPTNEMIKRLSVTANLVDGIRKEAKNLYDEYLENTLDL